MALQAMNGVTEMYSGSAIVDGKKRLMLRECCTLIDKFIKDSEDAEIANLSAYTDVATMELVITMSCLDLEASRRNTTFYKILKYLKRFEIEWESEDTIRLIFVFGSVWNK